MELVMNPKGDIAMVTTQESSYASTRGAICHERRKTIIEQR
jgi:hypothetical protein